MSDIRKIAVVGIHGVGDHAQFSTAREIGDLLTNLEYKPSSTPRYAPFTEAMKRLSVRRVITRDRPDNTWGPMEAIARATFQDQLRIKALHEGDNLPDSLDHLFMQGQLEKYKGERPEDTYQCLRLEGKRVAPVVAGKGQLGAAPAHDAAGELASELIDEGVGLSRHPKGPAAPETPAGTSEDPASPGTQEKLIHIYEMYWADLSTLGNAFTRVFGELYQLLFHLGSVSVKNVLAAAIHLHGSNTKVGLVWRDFARAQKFAVGVLAWPIPILNLLMAALVPGVVLVSLMRSHLSAASEYLVLDALVAVLTVAGVGYGLSKLRDCPIWLFTLPLASIGAAAGVLGYWKIPIERNTTEVIVAGIVLGISLGVVALIIQAYEKRLPGSRRAAKWVGALLALATALNFMLRKAWSADSVYPAITAGLDVLEIAFGLLGVAWAVFYVAYGWTYVAGWRALKSVPKQGDSGAEYYKARRTRWTSRLVLALSSIIFITLTISVWTGVVKMVVMMLPGQENVPAADPCSRGTSRCYSAGPDKDGPCQAGCVPVRYRPASSIVYDFFWRNALQGFHRGLLDSLENQASKDLDHPPLVSEWSNQMLLSAGVGLLPVYLAALLVTLIMTLWSLFPSVWAEVNPPESGPHLEKRSEAMGVWLDQGFRFLRWGGELLYWTIWLPVVIVAVLNFRLLDWIYGDHPSAFKFIAIVGGLVAGTAIGLVGFGGRLTKLAGGLRPALRVMLDVDNWLREHPRESNPTARICGRYVSLLRHISEWKDADGKGYNAVVIVAHSQGTVITADFLRFLKAESEFAGSMAAYDPELSRFGELDIYFFTMGSPLHQLYGLRFPHLYGWAREDNPNRMNGATGPPDIGPDEAPRPNRLGIKRWINAYRSGDYVGRYLWRGGRAGYQWMPATTSYDEQWDPPAGKPARVSADQAGERIEFCIGPGAHTHYWDHTGGLVAEVLDRIINNA